MATQQIEFSGPAGRSLTLRVEEPGTDTILAESLAVERDERTGTYLAEFEDFELEGDFHLTVVDSVYGPILDGWATLEDVDGVFYPRSAKASAVASTEVSSLSSAALAQLAGTRTINLSSPAIVGGKRTLIRGDSYLAEHDRAIQFSRSDFPDLPGDGYTVKLTAKHEDGESPDIDLTGEIVVATGMKVVSFDVDSSDSADWIPGVYRYDVQIEFPDGNVATFAGPIAPDEKPLTLRVIEGVTPQG